MLMNRCSLLAVWILILAVSGCGGGAGPGLSLVSGLVTFEGKPVGPGTVAFLPVDPKGNPASGTIEKNGRFKMSVYNPGDGVIPGEYKVAVTVVKEPAHADDKGNLIPPTYLSPDRYMNPETSGFKVTVEKSKSQDLKFDLKP